MGNRFDELTKALAGDEPGAGGRTSRREALRKVGVGLAGALLASLGMGTAWGRGGNACKQYCQRFPLGEERNHCLLVCQACPSPAMLCGTNGLDLVCCRLSCCARSDGNGSYCTDVSSDADNCGACGRSCLPMQPPGTWRACSAGTCVYTCQPGYTDCGQVATIGCPDLSSDPKHCGTCGNVCPPSAPYCVSGACLPCPSSDETACPDGCVQLYQDTRNCGACGHICPAGAPSCLNGICSPCSSTNLTPCPGGCVSLTSDPGNCGACGHACSGATPYCINGACAQCPAFQVLCGGVCTSLNTIANCGACGHRCPAGYICIGEVCRHFHM